jgi:hypothetical protein
MEPVVICAWERFWCTEEKFVEFHVNSLFLAFLEHAVGSIDSDDLPVAFVVEILAYKSSTTSHIKYLTILLVLKILEYHRMEFLYEFCALHWFRPTNFEVDFFIVDC